MKYIHATTAFLAATNADAAMIIVKNGNEGDAALLLVASDNQLSDLDTIEAMYQAVCEAREAIHQQHSN